VEAVHIQSRVKGHSEFPYALPASGAIFGDGAGVVVLKRLEEAINDGDHIYAVIKGSFVNNDGSSRGGYTAPSAEGQAAVIHTALRIAEVDPESIDYIETHGTATPLGDPIEVEGLRLAFKTDRKGVCAIGSVKSNMGHLNIAAGITGFIKTVMAIKHRQIPPSLHFEIPNPAIDFINSPFYVNTGLTRWENDKYPLRAGISSFGIGGTNAHVVLEEAPAREESSKSRHYQLILLSAKTGNSLHSAKENLAAFLEKNKQINLADVAYTLQTRRKRFKYRTAFVCSDVDEAIALLSSESEDLREYYSETDDKKVVFVFPGPSEHPVHIDRETVLYRSEEILRRETDLCLDIALPLLRENNGTAVEQEIQTFISGYVLARLLMTWGIKPDAVTGNGSGEHTEACLQGVMSVEEALKSMSRGSPGRARDANSNKFELLKDENPLSLRFGAVDGDSSHRPGKKEPQQKIIHLVKQPDRDTPGIDVLLDVIGQLWLYGQTIDWASFYADEKRYALSLPTYAFDRKEYWIDGAELSDLGIGKGIGTEADKIQDFDDWFYIPSWKRSVLLPADKIKSENRWNLVFTDDESLGTGLIDKLEQHSQKIITVKEGTAYREVSELSYLVNPGSGEDYEKLFRKLSAGNQIPGRIIHLWSVTGENRSRQALTIEKTREAQDRGYYSLINIAKAIGNVIGHNKIDIIVITNNMQDVDGTEYLAPEKSTILGPVRVIPMEYGNISCRSVDIVLPVDDHRDVLVNAIYEELTHTSRDQLIAYRGNQRWVHLLDPVELAGFHETPVSLNPGRVYLITGGLGGIGLSFAEFFAKAAQSTIILTGRSDFPGKSEWPTWLEQHGPDDKISKKIKKLNAITEMGAEVLYVQVDVSHPEEMAEKIQTVEKQYGEINGIIHSAGLIDYAGVIHRRKREENELVFAPKLAGTLVLDNIFGARELDFFVLCSSTSSICPHFGQVGYSSANTFLDAFANYKTGNENKFTISINWDQWLKVGMAVDRFEEAGKNQKIMEIEEGILPEQGLEIFKRAIDHHFSNLSISLIDFQVRMNLTRAAANTFDSKDHKPPGSLAFKSVRDIENKLVEIWQELFGYEKVNTDANWFEMGGDSLNALVAIAKIQKELDIRVQVVEFFNKPTIAGLAEFILGSTGKNVFSSIEPAEEKEYYAISSAQKRLYILHQVEENIDTAYNIPHAMLIEGKLDKQRFETSTHSLVKRHQSFRTSFALKSARPVQFIHAEVDFKIQYHSLQSGTPGKGKENEDEVKEFVKKFIKPFDIKKAPLLRVGLVRLGEETHLLLIDMHHIISDAVSMSVLVQEFVRLYQGEELPPLRIQYKDFSEWQNKSLKSEETIKQEEYWLSRFEEDIPVLNLPTDYPRPAQQRFEGETIRCELTEKITKSLTKLAVETETTLFMVLLAAFNILLYRFTEQVDFVVGSPVSGRTHADLEHVIGMFVNTLPLRNRLDSDRSFDTFLKEVKRNVLGAYENQDYPFEEVVEKLGVPRDTGRNPIFSVLFVSEKIAVPYLEVGDLRFSSYEFESDISHMDLVLYINERDNKIVLQLEYSTALFKPDTAKKMLDYFVEILEQIGTNREIILKDIALSHAYLIDRTRSAVLKENKTEFNF
jgi:polyketide synthase PksN